ncbi:META domain-containing protein [Streptomyces sp. NBC_00249]|uniref:META domain-containing protein n=1 Tax=Streptomyces sp. NBC_00249 TaxID=2975690 RepID=UPI00225BA9F7|nr:META domain-containing protein [Streptomyces sp. NBC_00249]MCX5196443.1 META domain-containing protein [Streptomyces sp. NBC_00249]
MRTLRHLAPGPALLAALALTGCGGGTPTAALTPDGPGPSRPPAADAPLTATTWTVATVAGATAPEDRAARFTLTPEGRASGTLGCNRFSAPATVTGPTVTVGPLTTTRMACEGRAGEVERALTSLFGSGPLTWRIQDRTLTLTAPDGTTLTAGAASAAE